jgi:hypothetical protein
MIKDQRHRKLSKESQKRFALGLVMGPNMEQSITYSAISRLIYALPPNKYQNSQEEIDVLLRLDYHFPRYSFSYFATQNLLL